MTSAHVVGLGDLPSNIVVCIGNQPQAIELEKLYSIRPMLNGDISSIVEQTGNHWRKIFNIFAKLMFELQSKGHTTWQQYRDEALLQAGSHSCLLFSDPTSLIAENKSLVLISGKQYAEELDLFKECEAIDSGFYVHPYKQLIVTPYFDYRQLSNAKLARLVVVIQAKVDLN